MTQSQPDTDAATPEALYMRAAPQRHDVDDATADMLFLWGENDRTFPVECAERMVREIPRKCTFVRLQGASLMPHEERPGEVLKQLLRFLAGQQTAGDPAGSAARDEPEAFAR